VSILPNPRGVCNGLRQTRIKVRMTSCSKQPALAAPWSRVAVRHFVHIRWWTLRIFAYAKILIKPVLITVIIDTYEMY
ncbi:hypothetical protein, partial [Pseudomonas sp.]|uniref:hypothetical protein n=1 Tax=Pseudomonas sp. TaxID=306 RepID=UPI0025FD52CC